MRGVTTVWAVIAEITTPVAAGIAVAAAALGFALNALVAFLRKQSARSEAAKIIQAAEAEAQEVKRHAEIEAKEELIRRREEFEEETRETRTELKLLEKRLVKREDALERKAENMAKRERYIENLERELASRQESLTAKERELNELLDTEKETLYRMSGMTPQEARAQLFERIEAELDHEVATLVERKVEHREIADQKAREIISTAIQRCAVEHTTESVVSTIDLPSDDMKGRIIGREGRNIRAFEKATGVDVIVDDTPGVVVLSAFDSVRREMARQAMVELVADGRIHPSRIEEVVEKAKRRTST